MAAYWSTQEQSIRPACVLTPSSAPEVSVALKALAGSCRFAVKSGGHMAQAGAANIQGGVTMDLRNLNHSSISPDQSTVTIGPGLRWGQVYTLLAAYGLAVPGGRSAEVGVGGYRLGGGSSYFIDHGFGCDNVVAYEFVLASGAVLNVTAQAHVDLFRALKGGSSNFGIVRSFTVRTFKLNGIWGGNIFYQAERTVDQQLQAFSDFAGNKEYDTNAAMQMSISFSPSVGMNQPFYALPQVNPAALHSPQLGNQTALNTLAAFAVTNRALSPDGSRQMTWALSFENDMQTLHALYAAFDASVASIAGVAGISWSLTREPIPNAFLRASARHGANMLGIPSNPRGNPRVLCDSSFSWTNENDTALVRSAGLKFLGDITQSAEQLGTLNSWVDVNHADPTQNPIASYGSANQAFLQDVSRKYDPTEVFQRVVPGGFKVGLARR
ncbi:MAG: hypothetical protein Q9207_007434 [Kuettlingeria erythrocarpa]